MSRFRVVNGLVVASIALAATALASPIVGKSKEWTIDPPAGWQEDAAAASKGRDRMAAQKVLKLQGIEARVWGPAEPGTALIVQWFVLPIEDDIEHQIDVLDRGMVQGFAKSSIAVDRSRQVVGSLVIRDVRIDRLHGADAKAHMVRRYQPASDGLHVLNTVCIVTSDPAPCEAALNGVQFTVSNPISLHDSINAAYRLGQASGGLIVFAAPILLVLYLVRRRSRARAAVKAAAPPGSPPGPGAVAGGT